MMELTRITKLGILQFRANMYKHVKEASIKACWQCGNAFEVGEPVGICLTEHGPNVALCESCATELGLMDMVDERGFVKIRDRSK